MSYEIVRSIKIDEKNGKVFITCASNNVRPRYYDKCESPSLSKILQEQGRGAVEIEILKDYEEGNLQGGNNKYTRAKKVLYYLFKDEYTKFNWRNYHARYGSEEEKNQRALRDSDEFKQLLKKALDYKLPKEKHIISKQYGKELIYGKRCPTCIKWSRNPKDATKYDFEDEARDDLKSFKGSDDWSILKIDTSGEIIRSEKDIISELNQFTGTLSHHTDGFCYCKWTDGIKRLTKLCSCDWLITDLDAYIKLNHKNIRENNFLIVRIKVNDDKTAIVDLREDTNEKPIIEQKYEYTDFPLKEYEFYLIDGVFLLKGEY